MDTARKRVGMKSINQSAEDLRDVAHGVSDDEMHDSPLIRDRTLSADSDSASLTRSTPGNKVLLLTLIGGIGGFLFGYDTGVISGALPYLRDDLLAPQTSDKHKLAWLQELIVSAAVLGAGMGSAVGGWFSDRLGRKEVLLVGDVFFTVGALLMAVASTANALIAGRAFVGLGVGLASVTVPVYIAESVPADVRATLVTVNVLMITTGQFVAYLVDFLCTFLPGTWR